MIRLPTAGPEPAVECVCLLSRRLGSLSFSPFFLSFPDVSCCIHSAFLLGQLLMKLFFSLNPFLACCLWFTGLRHSWSPTQLPDDELRDPMNVAQPLSLSLLIWQAGMMRCLFLKLLPGRNGLSVASANTGPGTK